MSDYPQVAQLVNCFLSSTPLKYLCVIHLLSSFVTKVLSSFSSEKFSLGKIWINAVQERPRTTHTAKMMSCRISYIKKQADAENIAATNFFEIFQHVSAGALPGGVGSGPTPAAAGFSGELRFVTGHPSVFRRHLSVSERAERKATREPFASMRLSLLVPLLLVELTPFFFFLSLRPLRR